MECGQFCFCRSSQSWGSPRFQRTTGSLWPGYSSISPNSRLEREDFQPTLMVDGGRSGQCSLTEYLLTTMIALALSPSAALEFSTARYRGQRRGWQPRLPGWVRGNWSIPWVRCLDRLLVQQQRCSRLPGGGWCVNAPMRRGANGCSWIPPRITDANGVVWRFVVTT